MNLPIYSDEECILATERLSQYVNGKEIFSLFSPNVGYGITVTGNFSRKVFRYSYYKDCIFDSAICKSIGFSGSNFINTTFKNCDFENGNLHSCNFENVIFGDKKAKCDKVISAGFHKSTFSNCLFQNLYIFSCGFTDTIFYNTMFRDCTIRLCSLENAQFINCQFINVNMSTLNLEYTVFNSIFATGSIFPFATTISAYGLLQNLSSLEDHNEINVIYTACNKDNKISIQQYRELMDDFERFYYKKNNYYLLANLYISENKLNIAYEAIEAGLLHSIKIKDFRILRQYCKLVYLCGFFTTQQRQKLYENITKWVTNEKLSLSEYHNYQLFSGSIREMLLNNDCHNPTVCFYIKTNIGSNDIQKQIVLLSIIDKILNDCDVSLNSIELRHNSPFVDFLRVVCDNVFQFSKVLVMFYSSLTGIRILASRIKDIINISQDVVAKHDQHNISMLEQKKLQLEIQELEKKSHFQDKMNEIEYQKAILELKKLNLEINELEKQSNGYRKILLQNGIETTVRHTSKNLNAAPIPEMLHYNQ